MKEVVTPLLEQYQVSVYGSLAVSKDMHFTNSNTLGSHLNFSYPELTRKLTYVVFSLYQTLKNLFIELKRAALKTKSEHDYRLKLRGLRNL
jgi:hypothetical protein